MNTFSPSSNRNIPSTFNSADTQPNKNDYIKILSNRKSAVDQRREAQEELSKLETDYLVH